MERLLQAVCVIACVATVAMAVHPFAAVGADSLADGKHSLVSRLQTVNETVVDAAWGLAPATLAVAGGLTRSVGNRLTIPLGLVGRWMTLIVSGVPAMSEVATVSSSSPIRTPAMAAAAANFGSRGMSLLLCSGTERPSTGRGTKRARSERLLSHFW